MDTLPIELEFIILSELPEVYRIKCCPAVCRRWRQLLMREVEPTKPYIANGLIRENDLRLLKSLLPQPTNALLCTAAEMGNVEITKWLLNIGGIYTPIVSCSAAKYGQLEWLKWIHEKSLVLHDHIMDHAMSGGQFEVVEWLIDEIHIVPVHGFPVTDLAFVKLLIGRGIVIDYDTCVYIMDKWPKGSIIEALEYILTTGSINWNPGMIYMAARHGDLDLLEFLVKNNCPFSDFAMESAIIGGHTDVFKRLLELGCISSELIIFCAIEHRRWDIVFLPRPYQITDPSLFAQAVSVPENLWILQKMLDEGFPMDSGALKIALKTGSLPIIQWLRNKGCRWENGAMLDAIASKANIEILEWMADVDGVSIVEIPPLHQWRYDDRLEDPLIMAVVMSADLSTIVWLHNRGCSWGRSMGLGNNLIGDEIFVTAIVSERLDVLEWLLSCDPENRLRIQPNPEKFNKSVQGRVVLHNSSARVLDWLDSQPGISVDWETCINLAIKRRDAAMVERIRIAAKK